MRNLITLVILLFFLSLQSYAQSDVVTMDHTIQKVYDQYISSNEGDEETMAWTVLIVNSQDRRRLNSQLEKVKKDYKDCPYDWHFESPYYKLKLGAFRTRLEAKVFASKVRKDFPHAIEVRSKVEKEDFIKQD